MKNLRHKGYYPKVMITPLFPLPDVVLFPKTPVPLRIFEERHRVMVQDAMAGNRELTIALLRNEAEPEYAGIESVHEIACLGRIENCEEVEDGDYDIVVVGLSRVRIIRETQQFPYLMAEVEAVPELDLNDCSDALIVRHNRISGLFARFMELATDENRDAGEIMPQMDFESLVNTIAVTLNISSEQKQGLLEMDDSFQRCDLLNAILQQQIETLGLIRKFEHLKPENPHFN
ncbi:MAG: LON peptidase substrate-binding domain-containing protein [Acidobacteria bacterium]|nr:LON peptidase substrate-binding domain-containing protein [Acidobacteriota bacterium]